MSVRICIEDGCFTEVMVVRGRSELGGYFDQVRGVLDLIAAPPAEQLSWVDRRGLSAEDFAYQLDAVCAGMLVDLIDAGAISVEASSLVQELLDRLDDQEMQFFYDSAVPGPQWVPVREQARRAAEAMQQDWDGYIAKQM